MKKIYSFAIALLTAATGISQTTTICTFDFNEGTSLPLSPFTTATGITASFNGTQADAAYGGTATGTSAFIQNTTAGSSASFSNSAGTNSQYWTLTLGGSTLDTYKSFKVYFQSERSSTGATTITTYYSTDGSTYTALGQTATPGNTVYTESVIDLSSITALNSQNAIYLKFAASGASGTGTLRMDNLQVQASNATPQYDWQNSGTNIYYTSGNIGIGNNAPAYPLDVTGAARVTGALTSGATSVSSLTNSGNLSVTGTSNLTGAVTTGALTSAATTVSSLTSNGNVSSTGNLNVTGTTVLTGALKNSSLAGTGSRLVQTDATGNITPLTGGTSSQVLFGNNIWGSLPSQVIQTSGSNAYFTGGKMGIGNTAPNSTLDVTGSVSASTNLSAGGNVVFSGLTNEPAGTAVQNLKIDANGNLYKQATGVSATGIVGNWDLQGNTGTDEGVTNFLGTTDDKDLIIKTHGIERMRVTSHDNNNYESGRVYIGGGDLLTTNNDLGGNWDDKLIVKDALRVVSDNLVPSKCALLGNDGAHTYLESFKLLTTDQSPFTSPDDILIGWYSGANVSIAQAPNLGTTGGYLSVQRNLSVGNNIGLGSDDPASTSQLYFRGVNDPNHGLGWFSSFNNGTTSIAIDGPVLYGYSAGALATKEVISGNTTTKIALKWDNAGNINLPNYGNSNSNLQSLLVDANGYLVKGGVVANTNIVNWALGGNGATASLVPSSIGTTDANDLPFVTSNLERMRIKANGDITVAGNITANGNITFGLNTQILFGGDGNHGLVAYDIDGIMNPTFAGKKINGPVLFGFGGGALGSVNNLVTPTAQTIALQWDNYGLITMNSSSPSGDALIINDASSTTPVNNFKVKSNGKVYAREVIVSLNGFPDYVFKKDYHLLPLEEVKEYIDANHHLPNMPTASEVEKDGANLGEIQRVSVEKIEELTLYMIEMKKELEKQKKEIEKLNQENKELKTLINK
jgi:hypothetical protein